MARRTLLALAAAAGVLALPAAANAYSATVTADVNLRSGPSTYYEVLYTIPYGSTVEVYDCTGWCHVAYNGYDGYIAPSYVSGYQAPRYNPPAYRPPAYRPPAYRPPSYQAPRYNAPRY